MIKLKVGFVATPDPIGGCEEEKKNLEKFMKQEQTELIKAPFDLTDLESSEKARSFFIQQEVDVVLVMCCGLAGDGEIIYPLCDSQLWRLAIWCPPENSAEGYLVNNSLTCANLYISTAKIEKEEAYIKWLYGSVEQPLMSERFDVFLKAVRAERMLKDAVIARIGGTAEGFVNLSYDSSLIRKTYGTRVIDIELSDLFAGMNEIDDKEAISLAEELKKNASRCEVKDKEIDKSARLILAVEKLKYEKKINAFSISCWPKFQGEMGLSTCMAFGQLNERGTVVACEGDVSGALTMLVLKEVMNDVPPMIMDMTTCNMEQDAITFWHCGVGIPSYADERGCAFIKYPQDPRIMDEPGVSVDMKFAPDHTTICRFNGSSASRIMICQSDIVKGPDHSYCGARGWFTNFSSDDKAIKIADFLNTVFKSGNAHHYIIIRGNAEKYVRQLAELLPLDIIEMQEYKSYQ